jgi:hypothetical protein
MKLWNISCLSPPTKHRKMPPRSLVYVYHRHLVGSYCSCCIYHTGRQEGGVSQLHLQTLSFYVDYIRSSDYWLVQGST